MKGSQKFLVVFLVLTVVFSALTAVVSVFEIQSIKANTSVAVGKIAEKVKKEYPNISSRELAEILNDSSDNTPQSNFLKKYGIDLERDWAVYKNETLGLNVVTVNAIVCSAVCMVLTAIFLIYCKRQRKEAERLTDYVRKINSGDYDLEIESSSEEELSQLKSEIYKTTVMLKEQSDNSRKDKEKLKDSLSDISHQLKTPLTSIMIMLDDIIEDENMPDEIRRDFLNDIRRSANGISFLVQSILTLSKFDANSIILKNKDEKALSILEESVKNTAVLAEIKGVETIVKCDKNLTIACDFKWLCEAVTNIVKNCIEHTNEGGCVTVTAEKTSLCIKITVSDNGCGIDKADLPHIFERFYKGKNSCDNSIGIGLALAKTIIEKSGGSIYVDSELNKGTRFTIVKYLNVKTLNKI
ncbi:MAG: sensor histidine kinase [Ruminococcus sp.]